MSRKSPKRLLHQVKTTITQETLIETGDRILAAVSGGADSVALARLLDTLSKDSDLSFEWAMLHINHHLRNSEADKDEQFCRDLSKQMGIEFFSKDVNVLEVRKEFGGSIEETARNLRYQIFKDTAPDFQANKIALAHHSDDHVETILQRIFRGTGLRGMAGIPHKRKLMKSSSVYLIRPLLDCWRKDILAYLKDLGQTFCSDSTNQSDKYTRNWIRLRLIPELTKRINPEVKQNLVRLSEHSATATSFIEKIAQDSFDKLAHVHDTHMVCFNVQSFIELPKIVRTEVVNQAVANLGKLEQGLLFVHHQKIDSLIKKKTGEIHLPENMRVSLESGRLIFRSENQTKTQLGPFILSVPGKINLPDGRSIEAEWINQPILGLDEIRQSSKNTAYLRSEAVSPPLLIRSSEPGDSFKPLGLSGSQKLQDFFVNSKIPRSTRSKIPLVLDNQQILWVAGYRMADPVKVLPTTKKIIKLHLRDVDVIRDSNI